MQGTRKNPDDISVRLDDGGEGASQSSARTGTPEPQSLDNGPSILLLSDDVPIRDLLLEISIEYGFGIYCANDCSDALRMLQLEPPGMVVTDLDGAQGRLFLRMLRGRDPTGSIPIVVLTANNDPMVAVSADAPVFFKPDVSGLERAVQDSI